MWSAWFPKNRQILQFVEPQTNVKVLLIGSMHYNPTSIRLVETTVEELGKTNQLGSVIIESCDIRWNKTQEIMMEKQQKKKTKKKPTTQLASSKNTKTDNAAEEFIDSNPNEKDFLGNEMRAAWEVATKYHKPTVLGDQRINITVDALQASLKDTAKDIFLGGPNGWKRSRDEIVSNWKTTIPINLVPSNDEKGAPTAANDVNDESQYLNAVAFFDPRLLISLPVSLVKYPLSFLIKDPVPFGTVFLIFAVLNFYADGTTSLLDPTFDMDLFLASTATSSLMTSTPDVPWTDYALSVGVAVLETVVFARLLLKPLLADRNEILAKSVLDQCRLFAADAETNSESEAKGGLGRLVRNLWASRSALPSPLDVVSPLAAATGGIPEEEAPVYVPGSDPGSMRAAEQRANKAQGNSGNNTDNNKEGKIVVAVLGMAHCNGVMKLLREQKV